MRPLTRFVSGSARSSLTAAAAVTTFSALRRVTQVPIRNCRHSHPTRFLSRCISHLPFRTVRVRGSSPTGKSYLGVGAELAAHGANTASPSATGSTSRFTKPALQGPDFGRQLVLDLKRRHEAGVAAGCIRRTGSGCSTTGPIRPTATRTPGFGPRRAWYRTSRAASAPASSIPGPDEPSDSAVEARVAPGDCHVSRGRLLDGQRREQGNVHQ